MPVGMSRPETDIRHIIDAVKAGMRTDSMADELILLEKQKKALRKKIGQTPSTPVRIHPNLGEVYRRKVTNLREALNEESVRAEASAILQDLIEEIRFVPVEGELRIHLKGSLAEKPAFALKDEHPGSTKPGLQITLVAGARNVHYPTSTQPLIVRF